DAAVVGRVERQGSLKRWAGHPLFVGAAMATWLRGYDRRSPHFEVGFADGSAVRNGYFSVVLNSNPYTYLGNRPLSLAPAADLERGLVAVTFRSLRVVTVVRAVLRALRGEPVRPSRHVDVHTDLGGLSV